nr:DNA-directed RNA polymerase sigma-70 factor [Candidatus Pantoea persica]
MEDVIQETLLAVHRVRHTYDPRSPSLPWLAAIASARAIDALRQRGHRQEVQDEAALEQQLAAEEVESDGDRLTACQRHIVEFVHLREQSLAQAAAESNLSRRLEVPVVSHGALPS